MLIDRSVLVDKCNVIADACRAQIPPARSAVKVRNSLMIICKTEIRFFNAEKKYQVATYVVSNHTVKLIRTKTLRKIVV